MAPQLQESDRYSTSARLNGLAEGRHLSTARPFKFTSSRAAQCMSTMRVVKSRDGGKERVERQFKKSSYETLDWHEKAEIGLATLTAGRGLLEPDYRDRFLNLLQAEAVVLGAARQVDMGSFEKKLNRMETAGRILRFVGDSGQLSPSQKQRMAFLATTLRAQKFRGAVPMEWDAMRDAITNSPDTFQEQVLSQMAMGVAEDMETNLNLGDTASIDPDLTAFDGVVKAASANVIQSLGPTITTADLRAMRQALPVRFARRTADLRWLIGHYTNIQLDGFLEGRATTRGDQEVDGASYESPIQGYPRLDVAVWPYDRGVGTNETAVVLTSLSNLAVGVWQEVTFIVDEDVDGEMTTIYVTIRWTFAPEEPRAQVRLDGLLDPRL